MEQYSPRTGTFAGGIVRICGHVALMSHSEAIVYYPAENPQRQLMENKKCAT
jgi:hypothetical protein